MALDGHSGPKASNVQLEFVEWLSDPVKNGAGALFDFGCYGANLMTWLMDNQRPIAVTAVTQQFQAGVYPRVDDEATLLLEYSTAQGSSRRRGTGRTTGRTSKCTVSSAGLLQPAETACEPRLGRSRSVR